MRPSLSRDPVQDDDSQLTATAMPSNGVPLDEPSPAYADGANGAAAGAGASMIVLENVRKVYEPGNPLADAEGMVVYSNVNSVAEMADMMSASRAFETNVEVLGRIKSMQQSLLKLGEG